MTIKHTSGAHGWPFTDVWYQGGYSRFYGHHSEAKCLQMVTHKWPWPSLPADPFARV